MSVFKSIKGTLQSVQHDISSSFKSVKTSNRYSHVTGAQQGVNVEAGAELLSRFQSNWEELHVKNEENARCAEALYQEFTATYAHCDKQVVAYNQLQEQVNGLSSFIDTLQGLTNTIAQLEELFDHVEGAMVQLEDICEEEEYEKARQSHAKQFTAYKQIRQDDLEKVKVKLAQEHANKMQKYDAERQAAMKDRQEAFEDAFVQDVNFYKIYGRTERLPSSDSGKVPDLADITLDEDKEALDDFLDSADATPLTEKVTVVSDESSDPEAVFGNDDVTASDPGAVDCNDAENVTASPGQSSDEHEQTSSEPPGPTSSERNDQRLPELTSDTGCQNEPSAIEDQVVNSGDSSERDDISKPETGNTEKSEVQDDNASATNNVETHEENDSAAAKETTANNSEVEETNSEKNKEQTISTDEEKDNS